MTDDEKAIIILEELVKFVELDLDEETKKWYRYGILNGLSKVERRKMNEEVQDRNNAVGLGNNIDRHF